MAKKRISELTSRAVGDLTGTYKLPVDLTGGTEAESILIEDFVHGKPKKYPIGSWNMQATMYQPIFNVNPDFIPFGVVIYDDEGNKHVNGIYDQTVASYMMNKTHIRNPITNALMVGQSPMINVHCEMLPADPSNSNMPTIRLKHNCPTLFSSNTYKTTNNNVVYNAYFSCQTGYMFFMIAINTPGLGGGTFTGELCVGDEIALSETFTFLNSYIQPNTIITSLDHVSYDTGLYLRVGVSKQILSTISTTTATYLLNGRRCSLDAFNNIDYTEAIANVSACSHEGRNSTDNKFGSLFYAHSNNILSNYNSTSANRGYVFGYIFY